MASNLFLIILAKTQQRQGNQPISSWCGAWKLQLAFQSSNRTKQLSWNNIGTRVCGNVQACFTRVIF
jgi:hypothetical protein